MKIRNILAEKSDRWDRESKTARITLVVDEVFPVNENGSITRLKLEDGGSAQRHVNAGQSALPESLLTKLEELANLLLPDAESLSSMMLYDFQANSNELKLSLFPISDEYWDLFNKPFKFRAKMIEIIYTETKSSE